MQIQKSINCNERVTRLQGSTERLKSRSEMIVVHTFIDRLYRDNEFRWAGLVVNHVSGISILPGNDKLKYQAVNRELSWVGLI